MQDPCKINTCRSIHQAPTWKFLKVGDSIEIIAPSASPLKTEQLEAAKKLIGRHRLEAFVSEGILHSEVAPYNYYANSHEERAKKFINALSGSSKVLWALLGGFGAVEIVDILERSSFVPPTYPNSLLDLVI